MFEDMGIKRCFKCAGFHNKSECKEMDICLRCGGNDDKTNEPKETSDRCVSCTTSNEKL